MAELGANLYYMTEGCGIYAMAVARQYPDAEIYILSRAHGEAWSASIPYEVTHVYCHVPGVGDFDVKGNRSPIQMAADFDMSTYDVKGPFTPQEFYARFMGNSDSKPLYGTAKDIKEVKLAASNKTAPITEDCWAWPDGSFFKIGRWTHDDAAKHMGFHGYHDAYAHGCIRVSVGLGVAFLETEKPMNDAMSTQLENLCKRIPNCPQMEAWVGDGETFEKYKWDGKQLSRYMARMVASDKVAEGPTQDQDWMGQPGDITDSPAFKAWFQGSKVVDDHGRPLRMYHATQSDFGEFRPYSHFGTPEAANDRHKNLTDFYADTLNNPKRSEGANIMPVYLSIKNPLRMPDLASLDESTGMSLDEFDEAEEMDEDERPYARAWEGEEAVATTLLEMGIFNIDEFENARDNEDAYKILQQKGYDGIVYKNTVEDAGQDSWIAFKPNQVKSAIGNNGKYDSGSNSITAAVNDNLKSWFGSSKVVNLKGEPLKVYHVTSNDFSTFNTEPRIVPGVHTTMDSIGAWFAGNPMMANDVYEFYKKRRQGQPQTMPCYLRIQKPLTIETRGLLEPVIQTKTAGGSQQEVDEYRSRLKSDDENVRLQLVKDSKKSLMEQGYDGIHILDDTRLGDAWIAFSPNQIKSAIGNSGEYSNEDKRITATASTISYILTPTGNVSALGQGTHPGLIAQLGYKDGDEARAAGCVRAIVQDDEDGTYLLLQLDTLKSAGELAIDFIREINPDDVTIDIMSNEGSKCIYKQNITSGRAVEFIRSACGDKKTAGYTAYVLTPEARALVLKTFPPKFPDVIAHHVTYQFGVPKDAPLPPEATIVIEGYASDDSLEALVVSVDGQTTRPDGEIYHITLSLDRSQGRAPKDSKAVVKAGWAPVEQPFDVQVVPQKIAHTVEPKIANKPTTVSPDIVLYRGEGPGTTRNGRFWSPDMEFAKQFTRQGLESELLIARIPKSEIYKATNLPYGGDFDLIDAVVEIAKAKGYSAVWCNEGGNEPNSVYVFDRSKLHWVRRRKYALVKSKNDAPTSFNINAGIKKQALTIGPVYHGTTYDFDDFKRNKGLRSGFLGMTLEVDVFAFFFTESKRQAIAYAKNRQQHTKQPCRLITANLTINNLLDLTNPNWVNTPITTPPIPLHKIQKTDTAEDSPGIYEEHAEELNKSTGLLDYLVNYLLADEMTGTEWGELAIDDGRDNYDLKIREPQLEEGFRAYDLFDNKKVTDALHYLGFDGAKVPEGDDQEFGGESYCVLSSNQVKILSNVDIDRKKAASSKKVRAYHATTKQFDTFDTPAMFHVRRKYCEDFIAGQPDGHIIEAILTINNPADLDTLHVSPSDPKFKGLAKSLEEQGYDGAQYKNEAWIAFKPEQIQIINPKVAAEVAVQEPEIERDEPATEEEEPKEQQVPKSAPPASVPVPAKPNAPRKPRMPKEKSYVPPTENKAFQRWFSKSKIVDTSGNPLVVYHGTTHDFDVFNVEETGNAEGHYGKGFYFTSSTTDLENYSGEGPDLTSRIDQIAEKILEDWLYESDEFEWNQDESVDRPAWGTPEYKTLQEKAKEEAKEQLGVGGGLSMPCYLRMVNPVIVSKNGGTYFNLMNGEVYNEETEEYEETGETSPLFDALSEVFMYTGVDPYQLFNEIQERHGEDVSAYEFEEVARKSDVMIDDDIMDAGGAGPIISEVYQKMGYDGIVQKDADQQFTSMKMDRGTTHYIVWEPSQVKSAIGNTGKYDKKNPSITAKYKGPYAFYIEVPKSARDHFWEEPPKIKER